MAMVKKSITVTGGQNEWIKAQLDTGHYGNESELIRAALREKQQRQAETDAIRAALLAGEKSGISEMSLSDILQATKNRTKSNGKF
ncbi:type II toxin-antitoxin system ParD family antitoxin [uncultured Paraglaciecola sp.]|uniref:type II toxin-antitoxin system ParD family antitoxin n=1 Tax=uncultured Paraglaciecola sp. TaxID=1765024 RepID=UPI00262A7DEF|nr:type II toxin-antitoxin system ParD family antitoxin [uncultured Paraglaciecola sp.]